MHQIIGRTWMRGIVFGLFGAAANAAASTRYGGAPDGALAWGSSAGSHLRRWTRPGQPVGIEVLSILEIGWAPIGVMSALASMVSGDRSGSIHQAAPSAANILWQGGIDA